MPAASDTVRVMAPVGGIEFAAVFSDSKQTSVALFDPQIKKSYWIPVGSTVNGMTVLNYDAARDLVLVRINGAEKLLPLRKEKGATNGATSAMLSPANPSTPGPVPVYSYNQAKGSFEVSGFSAPATATAPVVVAPPPATPVVPAEVRSEANPTTPPTPAAIAKQEEEARMLVSDLLEIGMAQRKAYEEAQKKAAQAKAGKPSGG